VMGHRSRSAAVSKTQPEREMSEMSPHEVRYDTSNDSAPWSLTFGRGLLVGLAIGACLALPVFFVMVMAILGNS